MRAAPLPSPRKQAHAVLPLPSSLAHPLRLAPLQGEGDCLPRGPWLHQLELLDLSGFRGSAECLLPPALATATRLRVLALDWTGLQCRLGDWPHVQVCLSQRVLAGQLGTVVLWLGWSLGSVHCSWVGSGLLLNRLQ